MPLDWLGQLGPTMQQKIALQAALLALQREDDQIRKDAQPKTALGQRMTSGSPGIYAGPTSTLSDGGTKGGGSLAKPYFRPGAGSLEEALRAATPSEGKAPDIQGEAWALRDKMVKERQEKADAGADEMYERLSTLDEEGQKIALDATRQSHPEYIKSMIEKGYMSPEGELAKMKEEKKPLGDPYIDPMTRELTVLYEDGTTKGTGQYMPDMEEEEPLDIAAQLDIAIQTKELEDMYAAEGKEAVDNAYDIVGPPPPKYDEDNKATGNYQEQYDNWKNELYTEIARYKMETGQEIGLDDIQRLYNSPEDVTFFQRNILGMSIPTGVWDDETMALANERFGGGGR